ncbi:WD40 repeat-like protein [Suillus decipiens]|nr:WD40 repeat-like protein [Suillus decipiens]
MASASTKVATTKSILKPVMTLKGHGDWIRSISYFPDGQRMISGSQDKTTRQWDPKAGKEIEGARDICEKYVYAMVVSRDGRWVVTGGGNDNTDDGVSDDDGELKACEVETGIVKKFEGHSQDIYTVDISADSTLLASGSQDETARIWNLESGKLVAGPFKSIDWVGAVRFSSDSKKLAVYSTWMTCLEVWDIQSQKLDVRLSREPDYGSDTLSPIFWTNRNKTIVAVFKFSSDSYRGETIYEFDASTLETVGAPFEAHANTIKGLALSFDGTLLASASQDNTIKFWTFESRQLLASFDVQNPRCLILSPDSRQLVYSTHTEDGCNICICDIPLNILAQARIIARKKSAHRDLLNSDATRRHPAGHRRPPISAIPIPSRPPPTRDPQQPTFLRLRKLLRFSSLTNAVPVRHIQPRDPLYFPATSPLPANRPFAESSLSTSLPGGTAFFNSIQSPLDKGKQKAREPKRKTAHVVDAPLGQATYGDVVGVDDGVRPFVLFFCLSWFQKKKKKPDRRPVYDDDTESDEEEESVLDPVAVPPPGVQVEEIEMKQVVIQSQPEAGPSRLVATNHLDVQSFK